MLIDLTARHVDLDEDLKALVDKKLEQALGRWIQDVQQRVEVRFVDVNAARGGRDKYCRLTLQDATGVLVSEATESSAEAALAAAADRMAKRIRRGRKKTIAKKRRDHGRDRGWYD